MKMSCSMKYEKHNKKVCKKQVDFCTTVHDVAEHGNIAEINKICKENIQGTLLFMPKITKKSYIYSKPKH